MLRVSHGALGALLVSTLISCATAKSGDDDQGNADAHIGDHTDAGPRPDSGPDIDSGGGGGVRTLTQSASDTITNANSIACGDAVSTAENGYYRVFDLGAEGVSGGFAVSQVSFGIESAVSDAGSQPATLTLYTLDGAFQIANLTQLSSADVTIDDVNPDGSLAGTIQDVAISASAPAGSKLVVELLSPDGAAAGAALYIGSNADAETAPTFMRAADCGVTEPTASGDVDPTGANMHWVLSVTGTVDP